MVVVVEPHKEVLDQRVVDKGIHIWSNSYMMKHHQKLQKHNWKVISKGLQPAETLFPLNYLLASN